MQSGHTILFVYGTLKRGLVNHHRMAGQRFLEEVVTEPRYRVIDLGPYPGLIIDDRNGLAIRGELWAVDESCLASLDEFEGVAGPFIRAEIRIAGSADAAQAYFWNEPVPAGADSGSEWPYLDAEWIRGPGRRSCRIAPPAGPP
jgi:gamma-glutamylaminecyclotransferase